MSSNCVYTPEKQQCSICMTENTIKVGIIRSPYTASNYALYHCRQCNSRFFDANQHPVDLDSFYNDVAEVQEHLNQSFTPSKYWRHEVRKAAGCFGSMPASVLDVGCRTGDYLLHWPQHVARTGVEISAEAAAIATARGISVVQKPLEEVEFDKQFDVVACYAVMEHLQEPMKCLEKLAALVNTGGVMVVMVPSFQTFKPKILELLGVRWHMYSPPAHLSMYSREFLDSTFESMGFRLLDRRYTSGGIFNPFARVPVVCSLWRRLMWYADTYTLLNRLPVFDHMYSYYVR